MAVKKTFPKATITTYDNIVQNDTETQSSNTTDITNMQFTFLKHIPKRVNILTVSKTLKRIKRIEKDNWNGEK
jgi:hypothetical protein